MSKYNPPHHRFDTITGWRVFASEPDTETVYGNYRLKWTVFEAEQPGRYIRTKVHLSVDDGQTWFEEDSVWSLYNVSYNLISNYYDNGSSFNKALLAAREEWRLARRKRLDRGRREHFNSLPPEQRAVVKAERAEAWKLRKEQAAERKAQKTARIMSQMLEIGPELVRLKEDIENAIRLMAKGGVDRTFPYYHSRRRYLSTAKWAVNDIRRHIENAQKRAEEKNS
jgi:hypothetical protein